MKAFLMYRDRDFDPQQLLTRRARELGYRNADADALRLRQVLPWNHEALTQDLGLDILVNVMAGGDHFLFDAAKVAVLSSLTDLDTMRYRQRVFSDCLKNEQTIKDIYQIAIEAIEGERKNTFGYFRLYPAGVLHRGVDLLQMFVGLLKKLRGIADHPDGFESEGFLRLFGILRQELSDEYFQEIENHLRRLKFHHGVLISAELTKGNKGHNYVLRDNRDDGRNWLTRLLAEKPESYTFQLHPRDQGGAQALSALNDRGRNQGC